MVQLVPAATLLPPSTLAMPMVVFDVAARTKYMGVDDIIVRCSVSVAAQPWAVV